MTTHKLGPVIGTIGGGGAGFADFSITGTQSMGHTVEVPGGEEWLIVVQVTVTAAAFAFQDQLRLRIGGSVVLQRMAIGAHLSARLVTSTATVELSGTGSNAARGRIITTKIP